MEVIAKPLLQKIASPFATIFVTTLQKWIKFDTGLYGPLRDIIFELFSKEYDIDYILENIPYFYIFILTIACISIFGVLRYQQYKKNEERIRLEKLEKEQWNIIELKTAGGIATWSSIFSKYTKHFDCRHYAFGNFIETNNTDSISRNNNIQPTIKEIIEFDLPIFGKGKSQLLEGTMHELNGKDRIDIIVLYYKIFLSKEYDHCNFLSDCSTLEKMYEDSRSTTTIRLYNSKIFSCKHKSSSPSDNNSVSIQRITNCMISMEKTEFYDMTKTLFDDLFIHVDTVISIIQQNMKDQIQSNFIFYGPPGTGKSRFIYKLALYYSRDIISVDLRHFDKYGLYKLIQTPYDLYNASSGRTSIVVLEEFDNVIRFLKEREGRKTSALYDDGELVDDVSSSASSSKDTALNRIESYYKDHLLEIAASDLLESFQGPVPYPNQMIIATTNHFNEIKGYYPAIFRPGRMTPIQIGYMSHEQFTRMCQYYWKCDPDFELHEGHKISSAEIVLLAKNSDSYEHMKDKIMASLVSASSSSSSSK